LQTSTEDVPSSKGLEFACFSQQKATSNQIATASFPSPSPPIHYSDILLLFNAAQSQQQKMSLNKQVFEKGHSIHHVCGGALLREVPAHQESNSHNS